MKCSNTFAVSDGSDWPIAPSVGRTLSDHTDRRQVGPRLCRSQARRSGAAAAGEYNGLTTLLQHRLVSTPTRLSVC